MTAYWFNIGGLALNFVATMLLLKYSPDTKSAEGMTVTQGFERDFFNEFQAAIRNGQVSVLLLIVGCGLQFFGALLPPLRCP